MKLLNLPLILICLALILGVLLGLYFPFPLKTLITIVISSGVVLGVAFFYTNKNFGSSLIFMILAGICFIASGMSISGAHVSKNHSVDSSIFEEESTLQLKVLKSLKPNPYTHNYIAEVIPENRNKKSFEVLLTEFHGDSLSSYLHIDDLVFIKKKISLVNEPTIPHQFNYRTYLKHQHVYGKIIFNRNEIIVLPSREFSWRQLSFSSQRKNQEQFTPIWFSVKTYCVYRIVSIGQKRPSV